MFRHMCKSKIHRATVTEANLNYQGSITIDSDLLRAADILEHEKVHILNLNNAHRAETYAISGPAGSGVVCLNGAAARLAIPGDTIIIISYCLLDDLESHKHKPKMIRVDEKNRIIH